LTLLATLSMTVAVARGEEPATGAPDAKGVALFDKQIKPALVKHCFKCHSKDSKEIGGGLELDSPAGLRRGGDSGPILIAHDAGESSVMRMLRHEEDVSAMPPKHKLDAKLVTAFAEWIRLGAPDSRATAGMTAKEKRLAAAQQHWSFQSPVAVENPPVEQSAWPRSRIDYFVLARLEAKGLKPVADANRRTLVRRVFFDLVGLPPTTAEVEQFVADDSPEALGALIDRLLESPRFGERWGRHWLDVVRYAESSGMEFNFTYPHAWPYRDYVIDALNQDKPYDVFLREQIAGDLMPVGEGDSPAAIEARRVAPSILAFGPKRHNSGGTEFRMDVVDDQINTVFRATLAMTVSCARCHDHKFDPIPTKDYYALAGIFLSTEPLYGTIKQKYSNNPTELLPVGPDAAAAHAATEDHDKKSKEADKQLAAKRGELKKATEAEKVATEKKAAAEEQVQAKTAAAEDGAAPDPAAQQTLEQAVAGLQETVARVAALKGEISTLEASLAELKKNKPARPHYSMTVRDRAKPADTKVAVRGNFRELGESAPRGFLTAVQVPDSPKVDASRSGRLELAEWIASRDNPLTARVMVNRIWHHLFGRGLVASVDNFGLIGKQPSHPQLLDTLALQFTADGWSVKRMIRSIMLSRAYQLSSEPAGANMEIDPDNRLFWRATPRRLEAEAIRDAILAVSGQLALDRPVGSSVTGLGDQLVRGIPTSKIQPPSNHRSVYLPVVRDYVPELFDLFDFPSPSLVNGRRSVTNVPSQALYLRNSPFVAEQAKHAARRLLASPQASADGDRANLAVRWALARDITEDERAGALQLVQKIQQNEAAGSERQVDAWAAWFHTLFTTAEFRFLVDVP
jgi:hypothetical protein